MTKQYSVATPPRSTRHVFSSVSQASVSVAAALLLAALVPAIALAQQSPQSSPQSLQYKTSGLVIEDGYDTQPPPVRPVPAQAATAVHLVVPQQLSGTISSVGNATTGNTSPDLASSTNLDSSGNVHPSQSALDASKYSYAASTYEEAGVHETGTPSTPPVSASGWGHAVPVSMAMSQIAPQKFSVSVAAAAQARGPVSWSAASGDNWTQTTDHMAKAYGLSVTIDWRSFAIKVSAAAQPPASVASHGRMTTLQIALEPQPPLSHALVNPISKLPSPQHDLVGNHYQSNGLVHQQSVPKPVEQSSANQAWRLNASMTLRQNVEAWARQAGWNKVVWEGADYPIAAPAVFHGSFASPTGPLAQLIEGFSQSDQPLIVKLTTMDKVVHVYNQSYQPPEVVPPTAASLASRVMSLDSSDNNQYSAQPYGGKTDGNATQSVSPQFAPANPAAPVLAGAASTERPLSINDASITKQRVGDHNVNTYTIGQH